MQPTPAYAYVIGIACLCFCFGVYAILAYIFYLLKRDHPKYYKSIGEPTFFDRTFFGVKKSFAAMFYSFTLLKGTPKDYPEDKLLRKLALYIRLSILGFLATAVAFALTVH
jgi:hypothetical protein